MGSVDEAMAYLKIVSPRFSTFALASNLVPGMAVGIKGTISPPLTIAPEMGVKLIRAVDDGRWDEAMELQKIVIGIHDLFLRLSVPFGRTVYREGLRLRGFEVRMYPRWPSRPLSEEAQAERESLFSGLGLIEKKAKARSA